MPTHSPFWVSRWEMRRTVVVFPFVPVTATIGIRPFSPFLNILEIIASPTARPLPNEGARCIRNPGAAFTSTIPPPWSSKGRKMLSATTSTPQICKPTICAAATARAATSGCTSSVTSVAEPPVDKFALLRRFTRWPLAGTVSGVTPWCARQVRAISSMRILVSEVECPEPRRGSRFTCATNSATV